VTLAVARPGRLFTREFPWPVAGLHNPRVKPWVLPPKTAAAALLILAEAISGARVPRSVTKTAWARQRWSHGSRGPDPSIGKIYPSSGVRPEWNSPLTTFEAPDPEYWVPHGYAIVVAGIPGTWYSEGPATYLSPEEAGAYADLVEWAGTQPWSNGRVGLSGVSYLTQTQWRVAELNPAHLAAINPWEGWTDTYREVVRHGGIPETCFWPYIWDRWGASTGSPTLSSAPNS
jgi:putative CocE/NonD family hydrolase